MKAEAQIELLNLFQEITPSKEKAERLVKLLVDENQNQIEDLRQIFLTKDDKIEILTRLDNHFKWLVGIMITLFSLAIAIFKLL